MQNIKTNTLENCRADFTQITDWPLTKINNNNKYLQGQFYELQLTKKEQHLLHFVIKFKKWWLKRNQWEFCHAVPSTQSRLSGNYTEDRKHG